MLEKALAQNIVQHQTTLIFCVSNSSTEGQLISTSQSMPTPGEEETETKNFYSLIKREVTAGPRLFHLHISKSLSAF